MQNEGIYGIAIFSLFFFPIKAQLHNHACQLHAPELVPPSVHMLYGFMGSRITDKQHGLRGGHAHVFSAKAVVSLHAVNRYRNLMDI